MTRQFVFQWEVEFVSLYSGTNALCPKKQHSVYPSYKAVLKFSYEHPVIFTCTLVSLRIQFDWASGVFLENPVYKIG